METKKYKDRLEAERIELTQQLSALGVQDPANTADWITAQTTTPFEADPNDVADRVEEYDTARATLAELETRYNNVVTALAKITDDTFGICEVGGEHIAVERLEANPAARTCVVHMK